MPSPSKIDLLPTEIREELDRRIVAGNFAGYAALSEWLSEQGCEISKSVIGLRGLRLKRRLAAITASTEAMRMVSSAAPDETAERSNAILALVQTDLFEALVEFQEAAAADSDSISAADRIALYSKATKNIATLVRASLTREKWAAEQRTKLDAAREDVRRMVADAGVPDEVQQAIDARLMGAA